MTDFPSSVFPTMRTQQAHCVEWSVERCRAGRCISGHPSESFCEDSVESTQLEKGPMFLL